MRRRLEALLKIRPRKFVAAVGDVAAVDAVATEVVVVAAVEV